MLVSPESLKGVGRQEATYAGTSETNEAVGTLQSYETNS
jgi:hypothetical protein